MSGSRRVLGSRIHEVFFVSVLVAFAVIIVVQSFTVFEAAGLVPKVVGFPILAILLFLWAAAVRRLWKPVGASEPKSSDSLSHELPGTRVPNAAQLQEELDQEESSEPADTRKLVIFAAWSLATVVFAGIVGFGIAGPIALFAMLLYSTRKWMLSLANTAAFVILLWLIFGELLGVALFR